MGRTETEGDLLQDGWLALLRAPDGKPVSAASLLAFGADHARLQGLVTAPAHRRQGHARALVSELQAWLQAAGVPRLVAVLPERRAVVGAAEAQGPDGEGVLRKLGFTTLQDLDVLGVSRGRAPPLHAGAQNDLCLPLCTRASGVEGGALPVLHRAAARAAATRAAQAHERRGQAAVAVVTNAAQSSGRMPPAPMCAATVVPHP